MANVEATASADSFVSGAEVENEHMRIPELETESKGENSVYVVKLGCSYAYTIPSFSVICVKLRHAVIQHVSNGEVKLSDVFCKHLHLLK